MNKMYHNLYVLKPEVYSTLYHDIAAIKVWYSMIENQKME